MDCAKVRELISEYVEGTLPAALEQAVRAHQQRCSACRADLQAMQAIWTRLDALPSLDSPPFFHENVMAAVHQAARTQPGGPWQALWPRLGRVALGTLATGGALAAVGAMVFLPTLKGDTQNAGVLRVGSILPGTAYQETAAAPPRLQIARSAVVDPKHGAAYKFGVWLDEASHGTARFQLLPSNALAATGAFKGTDSYRFTLDSDEPQALVVPFGAVQGDTMNLYVSWTADGQRHTKYLFVPLPSSDVTPPVKQSFSLSGAPLTLVARDIASRYRRPVTLDDVAHMEDVVVTASQETATRSLRRALQGRGVRVSLSGAGILIEPDPMIEAASNPS